MKELNSFQLVKVPDGLTATVKSRCEFVPLIALLNILRIKFNCIRGIRVMVMVTLVVMILVDEMRNGLLELTATQI